MKRFPLLTSLLLLFGPTQAQLPVFREVEPLFDVSTSTWGHFPALENMHSAWGDIDGDGDLDVILMGEGPSGPVTKLFLNDPSNPAIPFAFVEVTCIPPLPQLQDGAMAWGDMDNDGDLDLAITGSRTAEPRSSADLQAHLFRNEGRQPSGSWEFTENRLGPEFTGCRWGTVSWGDVDNDGNLDLFISGDSHVPGQPSAGRTRFSRLFRNDGIPNFSLMREFFTPWGEERIDAGQIARPQDDSLTQRVTWWDVNHDSFQDLILTTDDSIGVAIHASDHDRSGYRQEVWIYDSSLERYHKEFGSFQGHDALLGDGVWTRSGSPGGVGDWEGKGHLNIAFFDRYTQLLEGTNMVSWEDLRLQGTTESGASLVLQVDPRLNYRTLQGHPDSIWLLGPDAFTAVQNASVDLLNWGSQQWIGSLLGPGRDAGPIRARFAVLSAEANVGLGFVRQIETSALQGRFLGVLDAVDVNRDGLIDVLHSGFSDYDRWYEGDPELAGLGTRLYQNIWKVTTNTPPTAPTGLVAEVAGNGVLFRWNPSTDAQSKSSALRYAIRLKHEAGRYYLRPGATDAGQRLKPGLDGTLFGTNYFFHPDRRRRNPRLPDGDYSWSVQAVDTGLMGSAFAPEQHFRIGPGPLPPDTGERRSDLPYRDTAIDLGDLDNDGDLDVVLGGTAENRSPGPTTIRRNDDPHPTDLATHRFSAAGGDLPALQRGAVRWGDVDGDGSVDLALSGNSLGQPITRVYRNRGGVLELRNSLDGVEYSALDWGDFDNDGDLDLIVTGYQSGMPRTFLYRNGGTNNVSPGKLESFATTLPNFGAGAVAWGDYDNDGDLDLLLCGDTQDYSQPPAPCTPPVVRPPGATYLCQNSTHPPAPMTTLFRNDGLGTRGRDSGKWLFTRVGIEFPGYFSYSGSRALTAKAEWCDLSGDGTLDLVLAGMSTMPGLPEFGVPSAKTFRNAGPGPMLGEWSFSPGQELLSGFFEDALQTFTCADWNGDGRPELLLGGWLNGPGTVPLQLVHNDGMNFTRRTDFVTTDAAGVQQFAGGLAMFGHYNDDANVDVAFSGRWGIQSGLPGNNTGTAGRLFLNSPTAGNSLPTVPTNLGATVSGAGTEITLSWDRAFDNGLQPVLPSYNLSVVRVDGQPGGMPGMADRATGKRRVSRIGNVGHRTSWTLRDLPAGTYHWSVQSIDAALATSEFATAAETFTAAPPLPPVITPLAPLHLWTVAHPTFTVADLTAVAAARGARLFTGQRGQIFLSRRGAPFFEVDSGVFTDLHDVLIDTEGAIVVGAAGVIRTSSDGVLWTESPSGVTATLRTIARGGTGWVVAGDGQILHSMDRRSWTPGTLPAGTMVYDVTWDMGRYIAVGQRGKDEVVLTSTDGLIWSPVTPPGLLSGRLTGVASDGKMFVAVGGSDTIGAGFVIHADILTSLDGLTWTSVTLSSDAERLRKIIHSGGTWYAVNDLQVVSSTDLTSWVSVSPGSPTFPEYFSALAEGDGLVTAVGACGTIIDAPASTGAPPVPDDWTRRSGTPGLERSYYRFSHIVNHEATVVAVGSAGVNFHSEDGGRTWERGADGSFNGFNGLAWGAGRFVRTYKEGIESSTDGITWEATRTRDARAVAFGNGRFVAARTSGGFVVSTDGLSWTPAGNGPPWCDAVVFGNGRFLARETFSGNVHSSIDGLTWTQASVVSGFGIFSFARDQFFARVSAGFFQPEILHFSMDGVTWQPVLGVPGDALPGQIVWHRDRFVMIGVPTLTSTDLITWTPVPIPASPVAAVSTDQGLIVAAAGQALLLARDTDSVTPPPVSPTLSLTSPPAPGLLNFSITGRLGQSVTLEQSESLSSWASLKTITLTGGTESVEIRIANPSTSAFFRLSWAP